MLVQGERTGEAVSRPLRPVEWDITADVSQAEPQMPPDLHMSALQPPCPSAANQPPPEDSWAALASCVSDAETAAEGSWELVEAVYRQISSFF